MATLTTSVTNNLVILDLKDWTKWYRTKSILTKWLTSHKLHKVWWATTIVASFYITMSMYIIIFWTDFRLSVALLNLAQCIENIVNNLCSYWTSCSLVCCFPFLVVCCSLVCFSRALSGGVTDGKINVWLLQMELTWCWFVYVNSVFFCRFFICLF